MKRLGSFASALVLLASAPAWGQEFQLEKGLVFGKGGDTELKLDLAMPKAGDGPFPAVLCVHGGGWKAGNRAEALPVAVLLAQRGYVAVTVDYRLTPADRFPACLEDCKAAVRWLRANAAKYKVDPARVGAVGFSAGGHLVCMLGTTGKDDGFEGSGGNAGESSAVQAVASFAGPTDLTAKTWTADNDKNYFVPLLGGTRAEKPALYAKASPITYAREGTPPFLFLHGTADELVDVSQSRAMCAKLKELGGSARLYEMQGEGHGPKPAKFLEALDEARKFFDEKLAKAK